MAKCDECNNICASYRVKQSKVTCSCCLGTSINISLSKNISYKEAFEQQSHNKTQQTKDLESRNQKREVERKRIIADVLGSKGY